MLVIGIDEAGRGPVLGPMVVTGVLMRDENEIELRKLGVKDSKQLTFKRREFLLDKIDALILDKEIVIVTSAEIDDYNQRGVNLNEVEAIAASKIIARLNKGKETTRVIVDCPSISIMNWTETLKFKIDNLSNLEIHCEHKADQNHLCVSAASIIAKQRREKEIAELKEIFGDIGSGYTSDPTTRKYLEKFVIKHADRGLFRKCWATYKDEVKKQGQETL